MLNTAYPVAGVCYVCDENTKVIDCRYPNKIEKLCLTCYKSITPAQGKPNEKTFQENWGNTEIEKQFTIALTKYAPKMLHELISEYKGPLKVRLLSEKPQKEALA